MGREIRTAREVRPKPECQAEPPEGADQDVEVSAGPGIEVALGLILAGALSASVLWIVGLLIFL